MAEYNSDRTGANIDATLDKADSAIQPYDDATLGDVVAESLVIGKSELSNDLSHGRAANTLMRNIQPGGTRFHIEPNGEVAGTKAKLDLMFDPYEDNNQDYRIQNFYTTDDPNQKTNGVAVWNASANGSNFGIYPSQNFGFSENGPTAIPMKVLYFDTSDSEWRTPYKSGWRTGNTYNTGDFVTASFKLYRATTSGVSGETIPSHTSGNSSDGVINWEFIRDFGLSAGRGDLRPCVIFGDRDDLPLFGFKNARTQYAKDSVIWNGVKFIFTNNVGNSIFTLGTDINTDNLYLRSQSGNFIRFDDSKSFMQWSGISEASNEKPFSAGETSPNIEGARVVTFRNSSPTNVDDFDGGIGYQRFTVHATNSNTTLVNGSNIKLSGGVNKTLNENEALMFEMNANGSIAKQIIG